MSALRARLFRAVHAEGLKRGFDHDGLRDLFRQRFGLESMSQASDRQLTEVYHGWTGKGLKRAGALKRPGGSPDLPRRGYRDGKQVELVSASELEMLAQVFHDLGWGEETRRAFTARQLRGREQVRTRGDFWKVLNGARAMLRRKSA